MAQAGEEGRGKLRKAAGRSTHPLIRRCPNGETRRGAIPVTPYEESEPGELKHLSTRRKRNQIEIPSVAASESGLAKTGSACTPGVVGLMRGLPVWASGSSRSDLERSTVAGESPVGEGRRLSIRHLSRARHVEAGLNPRGPSRKAKYSLATDSEPSSASERCEEPR